MHFLSSWVSSYYNSLTLEDKRIKEEITNSFLLLSSSDSGKIRGGAIGLYQYIQNKKYHNVIYQKLTYLLKTEMEPYPPKGWGRHDEYELGFMQPLLDLITYFKDKEKDALYRIIIENSLLSATVLYAIQMRGYLEEDFQFVLENNIHSSVRRRVLAVLFDLKLPFSKKLIASRLKDKEWTVISDAADYLTILGPSDYENDLIYLLNSTHNEYVKSPVVKALWIINTERSISALFEFKKNNKDNWNEIRNHHSYRDGTVNMVIDWESLENKLKIK